MPLLSLPYPTVLLLDLGAHPGWGTWRYPLLRLWFLVLLTVAAPANAHIVPETRLLPQDPESHASTGYLSISHHMAEVLV